MDSLETIHALDAKIDKLEDRLRELEQQRQEIVNAEALKVAEFQIGQEVEMRRKRYRVTRIVGELLDYGNIKPNMHKFDARYFGKRIKKDGKLSDASETSLYFAKPITEVR